MLYILFKSWWLLFANYLYPFTFFIMGYTILGPCITKIYLLYNKLCWKYKIINNNYFKAKQDTWNNFFNKEGTYFDYFPDSDNSTHRYGYIPTSEIQI